MVRAQRGGIRPGVCTGTQSDRSLQGRTRDGASRTLPERIQALRVEDCTPSGLRPHPRVMNIGKKSWAIAEGYIPPYSHGPAPQMTSHEAVCILNASDDSATVEITLYYERKEPVGPYKFVIAPRRSCHLRFNNFHDPEPIATDTPFSSVIVSDVPIVVQHTRLDSRQAENALISTIAFAGDQ